ncbi:MAG: hypothetical protein ACHQF2_12320, partial [Flavobacteriales bacterium]
MKKILSFSALLIIVFPGLSQQEEISPLVTNPTLHYKKTALAARASMRTFQDIFVYELDTIDVPLIDDFSTNLFRQYDADSGDANVTMQQFFQLMQGVTPMNDTVKFMTDSTFLVQIDTLPNGNDTLIYTMLPFISVTVNNL